MVTEPAVAPTGPAELFRTATAFWDSRMLAVAVDLDVFTLLGTGPATLGELCERLGLHPQPTEALLNGLCAIGILEHDGDRYRNGTTAGRWLDRTKHEYAGGLFAVAGWQFPLWNRLRDLLETGEPQGDRAGLAFDSDLAALRGFVEAGDGHTAGCGPALAGALDWSGATHVVDLGGARGAVLGAILTAHPHLRGTCFDLPIVAPLFAEHAPRFGLGDRMRYHAGDFFTDDLPPADVYLLGHLMSDWDDERCATLVARAAEALRPGGTLLVVDSLIDPDRPATARNWLLNLNLQLVAPGGTVNSTEDCRAWLSAAGLTGIRVHTLVDAVSMITGTKA